MKENPAQSRAHRVDQAERFEVFPTWDTKGTFHETGGQEGDNVSVIAEIEIGDDEEGPIRQVKTILNLGDDGKKKESKGYCVSWPRRGGVCRWQ